ncbi:MAG: ABC-type dipeptide/oligopeptide/nickel transport system, permease component [Chthonomonadales bacterium]|nr:ABC-type dipeptide/oligopeptide/nickel transport system, permease component [Chthonomonadales bacterium]
MLRYVIRRVLYAIPILIGVSLLTFFLFHVSASPQQIARNNLSAKNPTEKQIDDWMAQHGYNKPLPEQFATHMQSLLLLRFGKSDASNGEDIWDRIRTGAPSSFMIASLIFVASLITTICGALLFAYFRGTYVDYWGTFLCVLLMSVVYIVYIVAGQFLLGKVLKYAPLAGFRSGIDAWKFVIVPTVIGVISGFGGATRLYRTFLLDEMNQDYVRTARAKGVSEQQILFRHVLKNAAIPILTSSAAAIPALFLGSLVTETFFNIPGLGSYTVDAINSQDFAVVRAMVFLGALLTIVGYILTDISYALVDPRVRLE